MATASSRYEVRLEDLHREDSHLKQAVRFVVGIAMDSRDFPSDPVGRWVVRIVDRHSGEILIEHRHGHDARGAQWNQESIERCLNTMAVDAFEREYGISHTDPSGT